uniref:Uncharacterized protein LOC113784095 n=1 Tax=Cicer arietinum TaxID=3827 RepID=A0A3Q7XQP7_CICAR|nr:uncharacterized protein LOC113784095 [Cicer arietinum]
MEHKTTSSSCLLFSILSFLFIFLSCFSGSVAAYKNYTVGDSLGWFDTLEKPNVNYQKWVAKIEFSLGDFLKKYAKAAEHEVREAREELRKAEQRRQEDEQRTKELQIQLATLAKSVASIQVESSVVVVIQIMTRMSLTMMTAMSSTYFIVSFV